LNPDGQGEGRGRERPLCLPIPPHPHSGKRPPGAASSRNETAPGRSALSRTTGPISGFCWFGLWKVRNANANWHSCWKPRAKESSRLFRGVISFTTGREDLRTPYGCRLRGLWITRRQLRVAACQLQNPPVPIKQQSSTGSGTNGPRVSTPHVSAAVTSIGPSPTPSSSLFERKRFRTRGRCPWGSSSARPAQTSGGSTCSRWRAFGTRGGWSRCPLRTSPATSSTTTRYPAS
jgi:hypothetical protein